MGYNEENLDEAQFEKDFGDHECSIMEQRAACLNLDGHTHRGWGVSNQRCIVGHLQYDHGPS